MIVQLLREEQPVSLSTGLPVLQRGLPAFAPVDLKVQDPELGEVLIAVCSPDCGPADPAQATSKTTAPSPFRRMKMEPWADPRRSVPFGRLSSRRLFWTESPEYTHVLMDHADRRLVGVKEFDPDWSGQLWRRVRQGLLDPAGFGVQPPAPELGWAHPQQDRMLAATLPGGRIWACLHPCPVDRNLPAPVWCWDGISAVRVERDDDSFGLSFEMACEEELLFGLT